MRTSSAVTRLLPVIAVVCACFTHGAAGARPQDLADDAHKTCVLNLERQPLERALEALISQCDVQLIYPSQITRGINAPALKGRYGLDTALHRLLDGTGLSYIRYEADSIEIVRADRAEEAQAPGGAQAKTGKVPEVDGRPAPEVVITTTAEGLVATRTETPLNEIPQSIDIISAEQMRQQNNTSVADALSDAVGITATQIDSQNQYYSSRGFQINTYHVDGGAALYAYPYQNEFTATALLSVPDIGEIDHIEVLRGSDALFGASGNPGATINMVRKRPLDSFEIDTHSVAGSWNNYRQEIDVTGPLALDGALRGRLDAAYSSRDYFYQGAYSRHQSVFGVLEYELTPRTLLTLGGSYQRNDGRPFEGGLPTFANGADAHLPRDTAFVFDWERLYSRNREVYFQVRQHLGANWQLKADATALGGSVDYTLGQFQAPVDEATGTLTAGPMAVYTDSPTSQRESSFDATVSGSPDWLGRRSQVAFGADYTHFQQDTLLTNPSATFGPPADAYNFNAAPYPNPRSLDTDSAQSGESSGSIQIGIWASAQVRITAPWSVTAGLRVSDQSNFNNFVLKIAGSTFALPGIRYVYVDKTTPYFGTMLAITSHYSLYASYADIYDSNKGDVSDSNRLSPADGINIEAGVKGAWRGGALTGSLALYSIVQRGLASIAFTTKPDNSYASFCCYYANGRNEAKGVDLEMAGSIQSGWPIEAGYTFNNNRGLVPDYFYGLPVSPQTPRHLLKVWTSRQLRGAWQRWSVGVTLQAQSRNYNAGLWCTPNSEGQCGGSQVFKDVQSPYAIVSPRIAYQLDSKWQIALDVNNLFDKTYYQTIGAPSAYNWYGDPRNFVVRIDGKL